MLVGRFGIIFGAVSYNIGQRDSGAVYNLSMRYSLRTLLILTILGPPPWPSGGWGKAGPSPKALNPANDP